MQDNNPAYETTRNPNRIEDYDYMEKKTSLFKNSALLALIGPIYFYTLALFVAFI